MTKRAVNFRGRKAGLDLRRATKDDGNKRDDRVSARQQGQAHCHAGSDESRGGGRLRRIWPG